MSEHIDVKVAENGRMVLPKAVRKALGLHGDARVTLTVENDTVTLTPMRHGIRRARELYRSHVKTERTVADFLQDRQEEARLEEASSGRVVEASFRP